MCIAIVIMVVPMIVFMTVGMLVAMVMSMAVNVIMPMVIIAVFCIVRMRMTFDLCLALTTTANSAH
jgi:hypothetical protein